MTILNPIVPTQIRVSVNHNRIDEDSGLPLAFITNGDDNAANRKTWKTADTWAGGYRHTPDYKEPTTTFLENSPTSGFKVANEVRRYGWNGGNVVWRMIDPRGFEFEIPSSNMAAIICQCKINAGLIEADCYYARVSGVNLLVPVGTDLDAEVVAARTLRENSLQAATNNKKLKLKRWQKYIEASVHRPTRVWVGKVEQIGWNVIEHLAFRCSDGTLSRYTGTKFQKPTIKDFSEFERMVRAGESLSGLPNVLQTRADGVGVGYVYVTYNHGRIDPRSGMIDNAVLRLPVPPIREGAEKVLVVGDDLSSVEAYSKSYTAKVEQALECIEPSQLGACADVNSLLINGDEIVTWGWGEGTQKFDISSSIWYAPVYRILGEK